MFRIAGAVALLLTLMIAPSQAQRGPGAARWVPLGEKSVGFLVDRDILRVNQKADWFDREGPFRSLRFTAEGNNVDLINFKIVYLNGLSDSYNVNQVLRPKQSFTVDLRGERSYIQHIEFIYKSRLNFKGLATLRVEGEAARRGPPGPGPGGPRVELLGSQKIGFKVDRDVLRVGRKEGRFRRIALRAVDNDIEILDMKVFYGRGPADDVQVRRVLRAGERSEPIDLRGDEPRVIDRIEFVYRARPNFRGAATLEIYGVH